MSDRLAPATAICTAAVFLGGAFEDAAYYRVCAAAADLVVAADGGAEFLLAQGIRPDVVVGDFDSLAAGGVDRLAAAGVDVVRHQIRKDLTDGELAVDEVMRRGAGEIWLAGALGALDHSLGHLAILWRLAAQGVPASLVAPHLCASVMVAPQSVSLDAPRGTRVSLVPLGGDAVVSLSGLDYPLERGVLPRDACLGLGNCVTDAASVVVHEGAVAVLVAAGGERFGRGGSRDPVLR